MEKIRKQTEKFLIASGVVWGIGLVLALLCLLVRPIQQAVLSLFIYHVEYEPFSAKVYVAGVLLDTVLFFVPFVLVAQKIKENSVGGVGFGIFLGGVSSVIGFLLPSLISAIQVMLWMTSYMAKRTDEYTYAAMQALRSWIDMSWKVLSIVAIVLLICAYVMHWTKRTAALGQDGNDVDESEKTAEGNGK